MHHKGTAPLSTARLELRRFCADDAQEMYDHWAHDPEVTRFLTWPVHGDVSVTRTVLDDWVASYERLDFYQWAIVLRSTGELVGSISVVDVVDEVASFEIGYCIGRTWWRQGITSEALQAVIDYLFAEVGALRVCAKHDPRNPNSGRVMRRCGMAFEGTLRQAAKNNQGICDCCVHSLLRNEWEAARA